MLQNIKSDDVSLSLAQVLHAIDDEPEYPDAPPQLLGYIREAIANNDEDHILHMLRQTVRLTKECISKRVLALTQC